MNKYDYALKELKNISTIKDVKDGSTGHVKAIDFKLFILHRNLKTSNFVFDNIGYKFHGGLLRIPRVSKQEYEKNEIITHIQQSYPKIFHKNTTIRLEPEVELNDDYYYLHVEISDESIRDAIEITKQISQNYKPL